MQSSEVLPDSPIVNYLSLALVTSGPDPGSNDILEVCALLDEPQSRQPIDQLARFHAYLLPPDERGFYQCDPRTVSDCPLILRRIARREPGFQFLRPVELGFRLASFLKANGVVFDKKQPRLTCASRDFINHELPFLKALPGFTDHLKLPPRCAELTDHGDLEQDQRRMLTLDAHDGAAKVVQLVRAAAGISTPAPSTRSRDFAKAA